MPNGVMGKRGKTGFELAALPPLDVVISVEVHSAKARDSDQIGIDLPLAAIAMTPRR